MPGDVSIGIGKLAGKGIYAERDFKEGDVVIKYSLQRLSTEEFENLPEDERMFTHVHWGQTYLYGEPERYVNHSDTPNTRADLVNQCDVATRGIAKGEMITTDAALDDIE